MAFINLELFAIISSTIFCCTRANIDWNALYQGNVKLGNYLIAGELINTTVSGWNAWVYPGIKYASARRFSNPILNEDLSYYGNINNNVDKHGPACWQSARISPDIRMDEDCLYLDVYVPPVAPTANSNFLHPVLFWVHGSFGAEGDVLGGQKKGAGNIVQTISAIVVPVQYRTGVFGFLSTEDSVAPGNWGLADLKAAFEWLYATVEAFGGDKKRIVLGGHDTGASLISAMMLDPNIRNRVHSTLLMSGSLLAPWAMSKDSSSDTMKLAALMNCSAVQMTSAAIFNCLTNRSATDMLRAADAIALTDPSMRHTSWKLVVDGHHILYDPVVLFDDRHPWNFSGGSVYTVQTADAASLIGHHKQHMFGQGLPKITYALDTYINDIIPMGTGCHALPNATMDALIQKYNLRGGPEGADPDVLRFNMIRLANDLLFVTPITQEAALYAIHNHAAKGTQVVVLDYEMANEDQSPVQRENLHGIEFGTSIKLLASPNHQKNSSTTLLTRELSMLLNSILQRGYGFGENFDPMVGNYLELGLAKRWTKKRSMSFLGELNFHDFLMQQGCIDPTESSRQRSGVFSRDLSISPAPPIPEQPNNPGTPLNNQPVIPPPPFPLPFNIEAILQNLTLLANDQLLRNISALKDLRQMLEQNQPPFMPGGPVNFNPAAMNGRPGNVPPPSNAPFLFPPNVAMGSPLQPPSPSGPGGFNINPNQGVPRGGPHMMLHAQTPIGPVPVLPPGQGNFLPTGPIALPQKSGSTAGNGNGRGGTASNHTEKNAANKKDSNTNK